MNAIIIADAVGSEVPLAKDAHRALEDAEELQRREEPAAAERQGHIRAVEAVEDGLVLVGL
eukprot:1768359-Pyramimonas_sp.AAC.1